LQKLLPNIYTKSKKGNLGLCSDEVLSTDDMIAETYKGIRPAPGYPACPDHLENLLSGKHVEEEIGVTLTEGNVARIISIRLLF
jgi:5-methyltetrahydrofolate--homocysteine methyltransferase